MGRAQRRTFWVLFLLGVLYFLAWIAPFSMAAIFVAGYITVSIAQLFSGSAVRYREALMVEESAMPE
jgi:uncharacterized membrane protein YhaH (DUF805 family)